MPRSSASGDSEPNRPMPPHQSGRRRSCRRAMQLIEQVNLLLHEDMPFVGAITPFVTAEVAPARPERWLDRGTGLNIRSQRPIAGTVFVKRHIRREPWHSHDWSPCSRCYQFTSYGTYWRSHPKQPHGPLQGGTCESHWPPVFSHMH